MPLIILGLLGGPPGAAGAPEAHAVPGHGPDREQRGGLADVPHVHRQDDGLPVRDDRGAVGPRGSGPDQPHLAVRPLRAVQDQLRRAARLVHGLARRRAAHHAAHLVDAVGPHHPLGCSCPGRAVPGHLLQPLLPVALRRSQGDRRPPSTTSWTGPGTGLKRTAMGVASLHVLFMLFAASSTDVLANFFKISLNEVLWFFRFAVFVIPTHRASSPTRPVREMDGRARHRPAQACGDHQQRPGRVREHVDRPPAR